MAKTPSLDTQKENFKSLTVQDKVEFYKFVEEVLDEIEAKEAIQVAEKQEIIKSIKSLKLNGK